MLPKKLCSLGILDIDINLVLRKSQAEDYNFDINQYNAVEDLESLFFKNDLENKKNNIYYKNFNNQENESINYMDNISLSSNNNLINTLLFINRAYKTKTFIEFIMLNQMEFSDNTKFIKKLLQEIFNKNYFFIIENKIFDIPSKIKFIIKILNDYDEEIISMKSFELFEINEMEIEQNLINGKNEEKEIDFFFQNKINYNFLRTDYFLLDMNILDDLNLSNNINFLNYIHEIIKTYPKIKIILIIGDNINRIEEDHLKFNKQLILLSDIIFSFRDKLNNFYQIYNQTLKNKSLFNYNNFNESLDIIANKKFSKYDLIIDELNKARVNIPRLTVLFEEFKKIIIYRQGYQMKIDNFESYHLHLTKTKNYNKKLEYIYSNPEKFAHIFIAGFLSRLLHEKSFRVCVSAGDLLIKKCLFLFMKNIDYINDVDEYNVFVPKLKKYNEMKKKEKLSKENEKLFSKENKFILDCTNVLKSRKKDYNPLFDENCAGYLLKERNLKHLRYIGFINKNGVILKDPDILGKIEEYNLVKSIIKKKAVKGRNLSINNKKLSLSKTSYNTVNSRNYDSLENKKSPKIKRIFKSLSLSDTNKKLHNKMNNFKTIFNLPIISKPDFNFSNFSSKDKRYIKKNKLNLLNSKSMSLFNIYTNLIQFKRNFSFNNKYSNNKCVISNLKNNKINSNYFSKIIKKYFFKNDYNYK